MKIGEETGALQRVDGMVSRGFQMYIGIALAMALVDVLCKVSKGVYEHFTDEDEGDSGIKTLKADSPVAVKIRCFLEEVRKNRSDVVAKYSHSPQALAEDLQAIGMLGPVDQSRWASEIEFLREMGGKDQVDPETVTPVVTDDDATSEDSISFAHPEGEIAELRKMVEDLSSQVSDQNDQLLKLAG